MMGNPGDCPIFPTTLPNLEHIPIIATGRGGRGIPFPML